MEPIVGFRHWTLSGSSLYGPNYSFPWRDGVNTAYCLRHAKAAHPGCSCGFYAYASPNMLPNAAPIYVIGAIAIWGQVAQHTKGFRAEKAQIVAICPGKNGIILRTNYSSIPFVDFDNLEKVALEHGEKMRIPAK